MNAARTKFERSVPNQKPWAPRKRDLGCLVRGNLSNPSELDYNPETMMPIEDGTIMIPVIIKGVSSREIDRATFGTHLTNYMVSV